MFHNYILKFILYHRLQYSYNPLSWHDSQQHCLQHSTCEHRITTSQLKNNMTLFFVVLSFLFYLSVCLFHQFYFLVFLLQCIFAMKKNVRLSFCITTSFYFMKRSLVGCVMMNKIWYKFFDVIKVMYSIWIGWCIYIL